MNYRNVVYLAFFIWLTVSFKVSGQVHLDELTHPDAVGLSTDSLELMDARFHQLVDENQLAGIQTAIVRKGQLVHFDSYGYADIANEKPVDEKTIFRIFSMTKPIVSVALMQFYEQGKFKLEDPLHKYLPDFKESYILEDSTLVPTKNPIRIIDLLRHTSGYNYGRSQNPILNEYYSKADLHSAPTNEIFVKKLSTIPLQFEPGTNWQYGLSTNICGHLIEVFSGQSLDQYLTEQIFKPLGMNDTHFQLPREKVNRFTVGYGWDEQQGLFESESREDNRYVNEVTLFNGGGGLVSTSLDYLNFCSMLLNKGTLNGAKILQAETINLMFSDHLKYTRTCQTEPLRLPLGEASFGLGFSIRGNSPDSLGRAYGWGGAVGTYFKIDVEHDLAYVMMIQCSPYRQLHLRSEIQQFIQSAIF